MLQKAVSGNACCFTAGGCSSSLIKLGVCLTECAGQQPVRRYPSVCLWPHSTPFAYHICNPNISPDKTLPCLKEKCEFPLLHDVKWPPRGPSSGVNQLPALPCPRLAWAFPPASQVAKCLRTDNPMSGPQFFPHLSQHVSPLLCSCRRPQRAHGHNSGCHIPAGAESWLPQLSPTAEELAGIYLGSSHHLWYDEIAGAQPQQKWTLFWL